MNIVKRLMPLLCVLLVLFAVSVTSSCSRNNESSVKDVVKNELDQLKNLNSETTQKYIPYKELFPDATENTNLSDEINEVFSLFFQKFDYEILDVSVDAANNSATTSVKLTTIDAQALAKDFAAELLRTRITEAAQAQTGSIKDSSKSLEAHYLILNQLLKNKEYDSAETNCSIPLVNTGSDKKEKWEIQCTNSLENELVGGLIADLADPDILSPEDTLTVYLDTLEKLDLKEMSSYLGVVNIMNTDDPAKNSIAAALVEQVRKNFKYIIKSSSENGYNATVTTEITTFDSDSILSDYQSRLDDYLASADAVIDGSQKRYEKSLEFLLDSINNNTATTVNDVDFVLINDGVSWKLQDEGNTLGDAIFGTLTDSPLENSQDTDSKNTDSQNNQNAPNSDSSTDSPNNSNSDSDSNGPLKDSHNLV